MKWSGQGLSWKTLETWTPICETCAWRADCRWQDGGPGARSLSWSPSSWPEPLWESQVCAHQMCRETQQDDSLGGGGIKRERRDKSQSDPLAEGIGSLALPTLWAHEHNSTWTLNLFRVEENGQNDAVVRSVDLRDPEIGLQITIQPPNGPCS